MVSCVRFFECSLAIITTMIYTPWESIGIDAFTPAKIISLQYHEFVIIDTDNYAYAFESIHRIRPILWHPLLTRHRYYSSFSYGKLCYYNAHEKQFEVYPDHDPIIFADSLDLYDERDNIGLVLTTTESAQMIDALMTSDTIFDYTPDNNSLCIYARGCRWIFEYNEIKCERIPHMYGNYQLKSYGRDYVIYKPDERQISFCLDDDCFGLYRIPEHLVMVDFNIQKVFICWFVLRDINTGHFYVQRAEYHHPLRQLKTEWYCITDMRATPNSFVYISNDLVIHIKPTGMEYYFMYNYRMRKELLPCE